MQATRSDQLLNALRIADAAVSTLIGTLTATAGGGVGPRFSTVLIPVDTNSANRPAQRRTVSPSMSQETFACGSHWSRFFLFSKDDPVFPSDDQMRLMGDTNRLAERYLAIPA